MPVVMADCNNFYVSCERVFDPKLIGKPVVVLSNNDGCTIARSNEAKALGIKMGAPYFEIRGLAQRHGVIVRSSNYELYGDLSARVMDSLSDFSPEVEVYSIDEAFLELKTSRGRSFTDIGREMRERVLRHTGIPVSVGIAPTKTLAKVANHFAKRSEKAAGVLDLTPKRYQDIALKRLPVEEVWGVGRRYTAMLNASGISTALALRNADDRWIQKRMSIVGLRTVHELRGQPCLPIETTVPAKKMITCSRTFGGPTESLQEVRAAVAHFTSRAAEKLRRQKLAAGNLTVFLSTDHFKTDAPQYSNSATLSVAPKSDCTMELTALAMKALERIFRVGFGIRKAGVTLAALDPAESLTRRLWDDAQYEHRRALMAAMDRVNGRFGRDVVRCGLYVSEGVWRTRAEMLSPAYTTRWEDVCRVAA
ncbi:MAG: Y-family DNA polymerase [Acidobacteriota bacterium]